MFSHNFDLRTGVPYPYSDRIISTIRLSIARKNSKMTARVIVIGLMERDYKTGQLNKVYEARVSVCLSDSPDATPEYEYKIEGDNLRKLMRSIEVDMAIFHRIVQV